jgi:hypothetical protein
MLERVYLTLRQHQICINHGDAGASTKRAHVSSRRDSAYCASSFSDKWADGIRIDQKPAVLSPHDPRVQSFYDDIARWFALDGEPPNTVNHRGFRQFCAERFPNFPVPSAPTILGRLKGFSMGFLAWFRTFQTSVEWYALTSDGWRSDAKQHYRTVTMHFFAPGTWSLVALVLSTGLCKDRQIADFLLGVLGKFELVLANLVCVTTDNANAEIAGARLAGMFRVACGCHLLNLSMKLVTDAGKHRKLRLPSPVLLEVTKLTAFVAKLHNTQMLELLANELKEFARLRSLAHVPQLPTKPNNTRWNSTWLTISSCLPIRDCVDSLLARFGDQYGLQSLSSNDWIVLKQVHDLLKPFKEVSIWLEGEKHPTVPEFLFRIWESCFVAFYFNSAQHARLDHGVQGLLERLKTDIGSRLWATVNDVTLSGLGLHPGYKNLAVPSTGIPQQMFAENGGKNILTIFGRDLHQRVQSAMLRETDRLNLKRDGADQHQDTPSSVLRHILVVGLRRAEQNAIRPEAEIQSWFASPVVVDDPVKFWSERGNMWPLLQKLAAANFVAQGSSAESERVWSAADDVSGDDRSSADPATVDCQLVLKQNTPVCARLVGVSEFDVLNAPQCDQIKIKKKILGKKGKSFSRPFSRLLRRGQP